MINALTIDVEDYWSIYSRDWLAIDVQPSDAVVKNTEWFLETLDQHKVKATFFVLGEVAVKFPDLIRKIDQQGHEIASHGISHKQIFKLTPQQFRSEMIDSRRLLEDIISSPVYGYRAPAFSIRPDTKWALEVLAELGFKYDSSVFPIAGRRYGWPGFSKDICKIDLPTGLSIIEAPLSTIEIFRKTIPAAGGGYIRHFPYAFTSRAIKRICNNRPVIVYMHPYEIDTIEKKLDKKHLSCKEKGRAKNFHIMQKKNRKTVVKKVLNLLSEFEFTRLDEVIKKSLRDSPEFDK
jgi:polysaccharide deacetylase family protein (PEP-CTERM system associated)